MAKPDNEDKQNAADKAPSDAGNEKQSAMKTQAGAATPTVLAKASLAAGASGVSAAESTDVIGVLKADHRKVEGLFADYENAGDDRKSELIRQICSELTIHTVLEEELFYPACREAASDEDPLDEAQVEHDSAKVLIFELTRGASDDRYRDAKVAVLAEQIKHHVSEEEEPGTGIFAKAQAAGVNTPDLARRIQARRQDLQSTPEARRASPPVSFQRLSQISKGPQQEENMARQDTPDRDDRGRFTSDGDDDRGGGRGYAARNGGGGSRYEDDDRGQRDGGGRGWYGDSAGHSQAARSRGEDRSFSRDDDDRGRNGYDRDNSASRGSYARDRDDRGRFTDDDNDRGRYASRNSQDRDRDERGRFTNDDDDRGYRSRSASNDRDRDDRGRYTDDNRGSQSGQSNRRDEDDRRYRAQGRDDDGGRGWYGDSQGHSEAARRGWEDRDGGSRGRSQSDNDDNRRGGSQSRGRDDDDRDSRSSGRGGWFGDSRGHAEAARRGWEDRR